MAIKTSAPELLLLRAVLGAEIAEERLRVPMVPGNQDLLHELRTHLHTALGTLSYRERGILEMRYGLGDGWSYTLAEAGYVFKLTRERIRQLQVKALKKLRKRAVDLREFMIKIAADQYTPIPPVRPPKKAR